MITKNDDLLGTLIHDVAHLLRLDIDGRLESHNLTRVKWLALGVILRRGPMTQTELAKILELGNASVGRLVDRLEERGFVVRRQDSDDRRSYQVSLTQDAVDLLKELDGTADRLRADTLKDLSETEISVLNRGLLKLKDNLRSRLAAMGAVLFISTHKLSATGQVLGDMAAIV